MSYESYEKTMAHIKAQDGRILALEDELLEYKRHTDYLENLCVKLKKDLQSQTVFVNQDPTIINLKTKVAIACLAQSSTIEAAFDMAEKFIDRARELCLLPGLKNTPNDDEDEGE
jgi:hypothetical protein